YFDHVLQLGKTQSRLFSALPILTMAVTMPLGGWLTDRVEVLHGKRAGRALVAGGAMGLAVIFLSAGEVARSTGWIVFWFTVSLGALGLSEGCFWLTAVELGGQQGGTAAAVINTGGN